MKFLIKILITSFAVFITSYLLSAGIHLPDYTTAIVIAIVITLLNIFLKPILILLTIPATIFTFGLFLLVVNAVIILIASSLVPEFRVDSFWWALAFSIILSVVSSLLELPDKINSGKIVIHKKSNDEE